MLIILEGPDGAGKTTLADHLANQIMLNDTSIIGIQGSNRALEMPRHQVAVMHKGPPTQHPLDEYEVPLYAYRPGRQQHVICDRWHLGELIYPGFLNRKSLLDESTFWHIEMFLRTRGALLVHVDATDTELTARYLRNGDDLVDLPKIKAIGAAYHDALRVSTLPIVSANHASTAQILARAALEESIAAPLSRFTTYIGPRYPYLLLLGDTRNLKRKRLIDLPPLPLTPAFTTYPASSGHFLWSSLLANVSRDYLANVGVANACDVDDPDLLWETLGGPARVAMGAHAVMRVPQARGVPHPQWVRRFHHDRGAMYAHQLITGTEPKWKST